MKTILKYFTLSIVLLATSCFEKRDHAIKNTWVAFDVAEVEVLENAGTPTEVAILYSGPLRAEDLTINYTVSHNAVEGADFTFPDQMGTVVIPAGQASATFTALQSVIDNDVKDLDRVITLTIENAGELNVGFPGPDQGRKSMTITIVDNDCDNSIPRISRWLGEVEAEDVGFETYPAAGTAGPGGLCGGILVVTGDILGFNQNSRINIILEQDALGSATGTATVERGRFFTNDGLAGYEYEAVGVYDEETQEITMEYNFYQPDGTLWFPGVHVIRK